ncbi:MAG: DUF480 domain-containing protein [Planctomycetaceae bacterium]|nr:DUF480 domain-containing protein [Planctomycetaceae bacterium]
MPDPTDNNEFPPLQSLTATQRRVLGTLIEKALTVPESYPLTLKSLTTGCNQKSGRSPLTNISEDDAAEAADQLRALGLAAVVHTESGRTERYRHYMRRRLPHLSEPQVAILAELLLRGRQSIGDLRTRASRMAPAGTLDSLEQIRHELSGLREHKFAQSDAPLERRGAEIDHNLYEPKEGQRMVPRPQEDEPTTTSPSSHSVRHDSAPVGPSSGFSGAPEVLGRLAALELTCTTLRNQNHELRAELTSIRDELHELSAELQKLRDALGA